jgi:hypothetical protein
MEAAAGLLADRVRTLLAGGRVDALADLRTFVERYWPEPLVLRGRAGTAGEAMLQLANPGPVSRYLTGIEVELDGTRLDPATLQLQNQTVGEAGATIAGDTLGPEAGFYVRRQQSAAIRLPEAVAPGPHAVAVELGLAGVSTTLLDAEILFG